MRPLLGATSVSDLLLIRHGQATHNLEGRWEGWSSTPLTPKGREQAEAVARRLAVWSPPISQIYTSPLLRARQTAGPIARELGLVPFPHEDLREIDFGRVSGMTQDVFRQTMPEALGDFARRCNAAVVGDKWPWYVDYLDQVLEVFPDSKLIYNTRDPRGLWNSAQRFKDRNRGDELLTRMLSQARRMVPYLQRENSITIRYEDLVNHPQETCRQLCAFLGCTFSPRYLNYHRHTDPYPDRWHSIPEASQRPSRISVSSTKCRLPWPWGDSTRARCQKLSAFW